MYSLLIFISILILLYLLFFHLLPKLFGEKKEKTKAEDWLDEVEKIKSESDFVEQGLENEILSTEEEIKKRKKLKEQVNKTKNKFKE